MEVLMKNVPMGVKRALQMIKVNVNYNLRITEF
jgi:hypothetical protein